MSLKRSVCLGLSAIIVLASTVPALSITGSKTALKHQGSTWQEFLNKHQEIHVEYKYSVHQADKIAATGQKVKLPAGAPVVIKFIETIKSSDATDGSSISFSVVQDVKIGDDILIKAGSMGQAQVSASEEAGRIGQAGKITISDFSVRAVDGTYIPLRGTVSGKGSDKVVTSGALSILICPLFLLMKGGEATIPAGLEKTTYTAADSEITIQKQ
jgi:hypothetical protein